jgi:hypothetical protein
MSLPIVATAEGELGAECTLWLDAAPGGVSPDPRELPFRFEGHATMRAGREHPRETVPRVVVAISPPLLPPNTRTD